METTGERLSELEDRSIEIIYLSELSEEQQQQKTLKSK